jgi:YVTN family beta-propeller protein
VAVNPVTNKVYVANSGSSNVTVIDGATNDTATVTVGSHPGAVAVNPVTNRIYVANNNSNNLTVIDGATNDTTTVTAGTVPYAVAVNPVTNRIYVVNRYSNNLTVIDGATNDATTVTAGANPNAVAVNPVTNKIYVANSGSGNVTVIDGATNATTTMAAGMTPSGIAVNPVTNRVYVANSGSDNVTVVADAPANDTKVRAAYDRLPGDTTSHGRVVLNGRGVNRWAPGRTAMMGVLNRVGTAQLPWNWAYVTGGSGTDSISWSYNWGTDSLIVGENFVCAVPLEAQAATTNNLGLGSPFTGNLEVYPVYRVGFASAVEEIPKPQATSPKLQASIIRGVLVLPGLGTRSELPERNSVMSRAVPRPVLLDVSGRKAMDLRSGANDVRALAPGVYFVVTPSPFSSPPEGERVGVRRHPASVTKVVVTR